MSLLDVVSCSKYGNIQLLSEISLLDVSFPKWALFGLITIVGLTGCAL
jgi:hypothetical protein